MGSENLTKNTNSLSRSKTKLEEVVNSLAVLQANMSSSLWLGGAGNVTGNVSTNGSTILEQLNATRSELMRIRESQLAISALVETQGQLLVEQMARLNQLERGSTPPWSTATSLSPKTSASAAAHPT